MQQYCRCAAATRRRNSTASPAVVAGRAASARWLAGPAAPGPGILPTRLGAIRARASWIPGQQGVGLGRGDQRRRGPGAGCRNGLLVVVGHDHALGPALTTVPPGA